LKDAYGTLHGLSKTDFHGFSGIVNAIKLQRLVPLFDLNDQIRQGNYRTHPSAGLIFASDIFFYEQLLRTVVVQQSTGGLEVHLYRDLIQSLGEEVIRATFGEATHRLYTE
jgi:hypothetical protein